MQNLPHELYTAEQTRELDRIVIEQHQISAASLMARAGSAALETIKKCWPQAKHITVICGAGNNGGDGFELARQALAAGYRVLVFQVGNEKSMSEAATAARNAFLATGSEIHSLVDKLPSTDVLVDALFGTGLSRDVTGNYANAIAAINEVQSTPVLSLDIPSGIHANTGQALGAAVHATRTLSFIGLNTGLFTGDGPDYCGKVCFHSLDVPSEVYKVLPPFARRVCLNDYAEALGPRKRTGHKGLYGHLLVIGGEHGMSGAIRIAAEAGARVGAGLISVATRSSHASLINLTRPELMCHAVEDPEDLLDLLKSANVITLGPGLGQQNWSKALLHKAIKANLPMVVDADALNILSKEQTHHDHWVLTPHPGEAARLLNCDTATIQADRFSAVRELHNRYGGVIVLKGAGTLIYDGVTTQISTKGNPGMASGGMGDALAGVIGGLLAQGFSLMDAACLGVTLHGMAADKAAELNGERGMLAMDLMPHLRHLSNLII